MTQTSAGNFQTEWTQEHDSDFAEAVVAIAEDMAEGSSFEGSLEHYSELFGISQEALRHEWNLRQGDCR